MAASDDLQKAKEALAAGKKFTYKGKSYSLTEIRDILIPDILEPAVEAETKQQQASEQQAGAQRQVVEDIVAQTKLAIDRAKTAKRSAETAANDARRAFNNGQISEAEFTAAVNLPAQIQEDIDLMSAGKSIGRLVGTASYEAVPVTPAKTTTTTTKTVTPSGAQERLGGTSDVVPAKPTITPTETVPPSAPSVTPVKGKGKGKKAPVVSPDAWKDILRERFPAYNNDWLTENATTHFGQDVIELMIEAANPNGKFGGLKTEDGLKAYELAFRQTNYYLNTTSAAKQFDQSTPATQKALVDAKKLELSGELGDVGLDETTLNALASDAARKGLTGLGLRQAAYSYILKPADQPTAVATRAMEAADADRIRAIGRAYNYNVSDSELKSILTGAPTAAGVVLTEEGLRQKAQNWAKGAMPQLADQIDRGLTLEEIGGNYQKYAAQILEQPEDKIDMFSGPYLQAFGTKETGQMSLGDWIERLKSDSRFGWQYTKQANQQATDVALSIARAFGKVQ